ncbi:hypothetical protein IEQ34_002315 [Dendrobium chrysotoxum]|uniref:Uncharacterized protein n=1 Tax=Dendrobium chrysotoxum TaxID=161865 RepID=A0AAV7HNJ6_DENCH|nr:hypothetical protein IEQ34_002315 [Dendrobium chrysotoxum]
MDRLVDGEILRQVKYRDQLGGVHRDLRELYEAELTTLSMYASKLVNTPEKSIINSYVVLEISLVLFHISDFFKFMERVSLLENDLMSTQQ